MISPLLRRGLPTAAALALLTSLSACGSGVPSSLQGTWMEKGADDETLVIDEDGKVSIAGGGFSCTGTPLEEIDGGWYESEVDCGMVKSRSRFRSVEDGRTLSITHVGKSETEKWFRKGDPRLEESEE
ncbi:hypothetical protein [Actinomadura flavalba]|uniref:hypothetical protein n=1 Tax=Actinomadura flavalba TaxID=1120938 RepID=UPI0012DBD17B|nr:hypothetical protein [Actinomadura flavalba]